VWHRGDVAVSQRRPAVWVWDECWRRRLGRSRLIWRQEDGVYGRLFTYSL